MNLHIEHLPEHGRFRAVVESHECVAEYRLTNGVVLVTHTEVAPSLEGRGIAAALMAALLAHASTHGLKVNPLCSYARAYMRRHPETAALLA
jgi:uncharacterized protein